MVLSKNPVPQIIPHIDNSPPLPPKGCLPWGSARYGCPVDGTHPKLSVRRWVISTVTHEGRSSGQMGFVYPRTLVGLRCSCRRAAIEMFVNSFVQTVDV